LPAVILCPRALPGANIRDPFRGGEDVRVAYRHRASDFRFDLLTNPVFAASCKKGT